MGPKERAIASLHRSDNRSIGGETMADCLGWLGDVAYASRTGAMIDHVWQELRFSNCSE